MTAIAGRNSGRVARSGRPASRQKRGHPIAARRASNRRPSEGTESRRAHRPRRSVSATASDNSPSPKSATRPRSAQPSKRSPPNDCDERELQGRVEEPSQACGPSTPVLEDRLERKGEGDDRECPSASAPSTRAPLVQAMRARPGQHPDGEKRHRREVADVRQGGVRESDSLQPVDRPGHLAETPREQARTEKARTTCAPGAPASSAAEKPHAAATAATRVQPTFSTWHAG